MLNICTGKNQNRVVPLTPHQSTLTSARMKSLYTTLLNTHPRSLTLTWLKSVIPVRGPRVDACHFWSQPHVKWTCVALEEPRKSGSAHKTPLKQAKSKAAHVSRWLSSFSSVHPIGARTHTHTQTRTRTHACRHARVHACTLSAALTGLFASSLVCDAQIAKRVLEGFN